MSAKIIQAFLILFLVVYVALTAWFLTLNDNGRSLDILHGVLFLFLGCFYLYKRKSKK
ncbi:hypothetical protein [Paenibacillus taichungensis]